MHATGDAESDLQTDLLDAGWNLEAGERHWRAWVGPPATYDIMAAAQFQVAIDLGLREFHHVLDIGCGSLRVGRLLIPYLLPGRYCGVEPEEWLVDEGIAHEVGADLIRIKGARFLHSTDFPFREFGVSFDMLMAQSIFSHASAAQVCACLAEASLVMKPGSVFACTYMAGPDDYAGDEWVYPGCVTFRHETMVALGREQGLECTRLDAVHPNGQTWIGYQKPA